MAYIATKQHVSNRGVPPNDFLDQLVAWGKAAPDDIFAPNEFSDVYSSVYNTLGPWTGIPHRRAVMLEVMRVLAGFESSWDWNEGRDTTNQTSVTPDTIEAGAWQVSANSMNFGKELKNLVRAKVGSLDANRFQEAMQSIIRWPWNISPDSCATPRTTMARSCGMRSTRGCAGTRLRNSNR